MDFFDTAFDKAKEAFEIVSQKTEEVVITGKQKFNIATLENQRNKYLKALGEIFYNQLIESEIEDTEIMTLVEAISEKNAEIDRINAELNIEK